VLNPDKMKGSHCIQSKQHVTRAFCVKVDAVVDKIDCLTSVQQNWWILVIAIEDANSQFNASSGKNEAKN
jgi:hypothetical protein